MGGKQSIPTTREEYESQSNWDVRMHNYGRSFTRIYLTQLGFTGKADNIEILSFPQEIEAFLDGEVDTLGGRPIANKSKCYAVLANADGTMILREFKKDFVYDDQTSDTEEVCTPVNDINLDQGDSVVLAEALSDAFEAYL